MTDNTIRTVAVVGLGLIGGSLALALRECGFASRVVGYDQSAATRATALARGLVDAVTDTPGELVDLADVVLLAVPPRSVEPLFVVIRDHLLSSGRRYQDVPVISDVASVKAEICAAAARVFGELPPGLVPAHPIAGSEQHGIEAVRGGLFAGHKVIITPHERTAPAALEQVSQLWRALDARVIIMDPTRHDAVLAGTSHLPHLLSFALVDMLASRSEQLDIFEYAAGGFRDFTRIAASDPVMWRDIFLSNGPAVIDCLDAYIENLLRLRAAIDEGDGKLLQATFERARAARQHFSRLQSEPVQPAPEAGGP